jgi:REP element-mobilizing transposase RayT
MGRRNRTEIEHEGAIYHIIIKGIDGIDIFTDDIDRNKFLQLLQKMVNSHKVHLFSYVLMDTHFHLLLKTEEANLSQAMQFLNSSYAHWFNYKHIRKGHLFQDRYKSYLILNLQYLLSISSYISLNPVEAGMVDSSEPEKYKWGSFRYFISQKDAPPWLKITEFLKLCEINAKEFVNLIKKNSFEKNKKIDILLNEIANFNQSILPKNIDYILAKINKYFGDTNNNKNLRNLLIFVLVKEGYKINEIADLFHITRQSVLNINIKMQKNIESDSLYSLWLSNIKICLLS